MNTDIATVNAKCPAIESKIASKAIFVNLITSEQPLWVANQAQIEQRIEKAINGRVHGAAKRKITEIDLLNSDAPIVKRIYKSIPEDRNQQAQDANHGGGQDVDKGIINPDWKWVLRYNKWFAQYRGDLEYNNSEGSYQTPQNSTVPDYSCWKSGRFFHRTTPPRVLTPPWAWMDPARQQAREIRLENEEFLKSDVEVADGNWKGVKILGRGGQGIVGLWEHQGRGQSPFGRHIVIKKSLRYDLNSERDIMLEMGKNVNHIVRLLSPRSRTPNTRIMRVILEYCEGGDLSTLLREHRRSKKRLSEANLWLFFECFAKGLSILDHATERPERQDSSRYPICHFDIKPLNILKRDVLDKEHPLFPICKIADFGLATVVDPELDFTDCRKSGTPGYLTPEQFSARWTYPDPLRRGHVNTYGTHSNIWQIGCVMYQLATLRGPPRPQGFRSSVIRKFTYGNKLKRENYSMALKSLIWKCLCDKPRDRPDLKTLHEEIAIATRVINRLPPDEVLQWRPIEPTGLCPEISRLNLGSEGTGLADAPFIVVRMNADLGQTSATEKETFTFSVNPTNLDQGLRNSLWFQATRESTVEELKETIRLKAGPEFVDLPYESQALYLRLPEDSTRHLEDDARTLWSYGVRQWSKIDLIDEFEYNLDSISETA